MARRCGIGGALALLLVLLLPGNAEAQLDALDVMPSSISVPPGRTTPTYTVRWILTNSGAAPPIVSTSGTFVTLPALVPIGTNFVTLTDPIGAVGMTTIIERLRIPPAVVRRAQDMGALGIGYTRLFTDSTLQDSPPATLQIAFAGGLGGPFQVTRFELRFDDRSTLRVIQADESLRAMADVTYTGAGVIEAVWEIAGPALGRAPDSDVGFRLLRRERRRLDGSGRARLRSPLLPSLTSGLHRVRLRFIEPDTAFELPAIRYFVGPETTPGLGGVPRTVDLVSPPELASLAPDTRFAWKPVDGAAAYQFEILWQPAAEAQASRPDAALEPSTERTILLSDASLQPERVTGALVPKDWAELVLSPAVLQRLSAGRRYLWRLLALADDGSVLAQSPLREIRVPASFELRAWTSGRAP